MKDKLEKAFQDALENHELPYNVEAWNAVQKQLYRKKTPWYKIAGAASLIIAAVILIAVNQNTESDKEDLIEKQNFVSNKTPLNNSEVQTEVIDIETQNSTSSSEKNTNAVQAKVNPVNKRKTDNTVDSDLNPTIFKSPINDPQPYFIDELVQPPSEKMANEWLKEVKRVYIQGIENNYCINSDIFLRAMNLPKNSEAIWVFSNGKEIHREIANFKATEDLIVTLKVQSTSNELRSMNPVFEINQRLNIVQAASAEVVITKSERNTKTYVTLSNSNPNIEHLVWKLDNITSTDLTCGKYLTTQGAHPYTVETYDRNGCFARVEGEINVEDAYNLFVENTFTPNGDGINDDFLPEAL